jgi:hypothetical protein
MYFVELCVLLLLDNFFIGIYRCAYLLGTFWYLEFWMRIILNSLV